MLASRASSAVHAANHATVRLPGTILSLAVSTRLTMQYHVRLKIAAHCAFDKECTRLFFDLIDRRYNKEGNYNMIFTSNKNPALWREDFNEDSTLLCALDRIFDDATVFKLRGESFRGKKLETISLQTGKVKAIEPVTEIEE